MNDQRALSDQVADLMRLAVEHGLYDAHDWMIRKWGERFVFVDDVTIRGGTGSGAGRGKPA